MEKQLLYASCHYCKYGVLQQLFAQSAKQRDSVACGFTLTTAVMTFVGATNCVIKWITCVSGFQGLYNNKLPSYQDRKNIRLEKYQHFEAANGLLQNTFGISETW